MKQTPFMSFLESTISTLVGFGISLGAQMFFLPLLGVEITLAQNVYFAVIMTVVSIARGFALRRLFEALHIRRPLSPMMQAVVAEKFRQVEVEGYSAQHDDDLEAGVLAESAVEYLASWWMEAGNSNKRRALVKAGALVIAEGEKLDRARKSRRAA